jgi:hypothetical protein
MFGIVFVKCRDRHPNDPSHSISAVLTTGQTIVKTCKARKNQRLIDIYRDEDLLLYITYTNASPLIKRSLISLTHSFVRPLYSAFDTIINTLPLVPARAVLPNR